MSYRLMQKFWLDIGKRDERELAEQIVELKNQRAFTSTIRDALRLFLDLRRGNTDVLVELFPFVREPLQSTPVDKRLQEQIRRLEELLLAQSNVAIQSSVEQPSLLTVRQSSKPLVEITGSSGKASAAAVANNFLNSMKGMASGFFD